MSIIDQLEEKLTNVKDPIQNIDVLNALAWELRDLDTKRGAGFAQRAYKLSQEINYQKGIADSLINQSQYDFSNFFRAISDAVDALKIYEQLKDQPGKIRALTTLCWAHWSIDNFIESIEMGQQAQKLAHVIGDKALEANALNNLALAYKRSGNFTLAIKVYNQTLTLYQETNDPVRESKILINLSNAYVTQGLFEQALPFAQKSVDLNINSDLIKGYTFQALGQIYAGLHDFDQAISFYQQSISIAEQNQYEQLLLASLNSFAEILIHRQNFNQAIEVLKHAEVIAKKINSNLFLYQSYEILAKVYEEQKNFELALTYFKKFQKTKENLFDEKNISRLQTLQVLHQTEISQRESEIYQLKNAALEQEINTRKQIETLLRDQATKDELTGISNRRFFLNLANQELKRSLRFNHPLTLVLIDLDCFKEINDTFGHQIGDQALIEFSRICKQNIREIDLFARFGGDEFILLFPETTIPQASEIIERIRQSLLSATKDRPFSLKFSAGFANLTAEINTVEGLLEQADIALYQAKKLKS